ncbi:O-antigen ligase family protein [Rhodoplanes roseus]|uniref:O-antigen ligase-related domain-containing protein n=1 Tax=Rhodoplanes roseus TaxID=29409 RepID=A0A327KTQ1_9BRAD|nr:O-antigen ligase family protein [Rhodoplanes roseus]RAI42300.1 hypothetical protein CH341_19995 [Rhodoplanes roseus]
MHDVGAVLAGPTAAAAAYVLALSPLVLTNSLYLSNALVLAVLLPVALLRTWVVSGTPEGAAAVRLLPRSMVLGAVLAYLAALTIAAAMEPDATARIVRRDAQYGLEILAFVAATACMAATGTTFLRVLVLGLAVAVATSAAVNIAAFLPSFPADVDDLQVWRLTAVLGMPEYTNATNVSVTYGIVLVTAVAAATGLARQWIERAVLSTSAAVLGVGVVMTQARGAVLGVVCGILALAATLSRRARILILIGAGISLVVLATTPVGPDWVQRGASHRPAVWRAYVDKIMEHPLLGHGPHADIRVIIAPDVIIDQPHNLVLSGFVRGGIGAALAMVAILVAGLWWGIRLVRAGGTAVPLCAFVTMAVSGMVDYNLLITRSAWPWLTFWLPIGLAAGAEIELRARQGATPD